MTSELNTQGLKCLDIKGLLTIFSTRVQIPSEQPHCSQKRWLDSWRQFHCCKTLCLQNVDSFLMYLGDTRLYEMLKIMKKDKLFQEISPA